VRGLKKQIPSSNATPGNDRITQFTYTTEGRPDTTTASDGTTDFLTQNTYDNLGRRIQVEAFHTSPVAGNLTGRSKSSFDNRGRTYLTARNLLFHPFRTLGTLGPGKEGVQLPKRKISTSRDGPS